MDYRVFNVHTWSFLWVRIHTGVGHTTAASQHNIFDSEELSHFFLMLLTQTGFEPWVFGSRVWCSTTWATPSPLQNGRRNKIKNSKLKTHNNNNDSEYFVCLIQYNKSPKHLQVVFLKHTSKTLPHPLSNSVHTNTAHEFHQGMVHWSKEEI